MNAVLEKIDINNLDKTNWESFRFEEIAKRISEPVNPNITKLEKYVGLEHIDPENIHITRFGKPEDVSGGKLKCYHGDVIFGKRRAYQRKAAIAEFEGICSAHAFVFRANSEVIDPNLFPFFLHSDQFMHRMIDISVGGLSPTINWGDLKGQEFLLPPKDEQARLAELLWAMDEVVEKEKVYKVKYKQFSNKYVNDSLTPNISRDRFKWKEYTLGDLGDTYGGLSGKTKLDFGQGCPYVTYMNVFNNSSTDLNQVDYVRVATGEKQNEIKFGDILVTGSSETPKELGMTSVVLNDTPGFFLNSFCFGFRLHDFETLLPEYARFLMRGDHVRKFMHKHAQGSTRFNLSKSTLKSRLKFWLPDKNHQKEIAKKLEFIESNIATIDGKIASSQSLQKSLINQIF